MKRLLTILIILQGWTQLWADGYDIESATDAVRNMRLGWNLGNTLDSNSGDVDNMWIERWTSRTPTDYEKAWGQVPTTQRHG